MAATLSRIVFDSAGNLRMIVHPDHDAQLADPAFGPQDAVWADIARRDYHACGDRRDLLALAAPVIAMKSASVGLAVAATLAVMDSAPAVALDA